MTGRLYPWLVPRVIFPLAERFGGRRMWTEVCRLRELQWHPREALEARAFERLRALLVYAVTHIPYYRDLFQKTGIAPEDIRTLTDLRYVPITTKAALRSASLTRTTADNLPADRRRKMMTSGSTGLPFEFYWDRMGADTLLGAYLFSLEWAGVALWDTRLQIASPTYFYTNITPASRLKASMRRLLLGERSVALPANEFTTTTFRNLVRRLPSQRGYFIRGYPSAIAHLAAQLCGEDIPLRCNPKVVITYAETLTATNAATIRQTLRCGVVNYYSSWEVPQMAQTCPDNPEVLHVNTERVLLRIVRPDGTTAGPGESGSVVVTDLANYVMPFINYSIGDCAVAGSPCPCGRGFPTLTRLEGRDTEVLYLPERRQMSSVVLGQFLAFVIGTIPYIWEYQAIQHAPDAVTLHVVPTPRFTPEFASTLHDRLETFLGPGVRVTVTPVNAISLEASGKRLIIKSFLPKT